MSTLVTKTFTKTSVKVLTKDGEKDYIFTGKDLTLNDMKIKCAMENKPLPVKIISSDITSETYTMTFAEYVKICDKIYDKAKAATYGMYRTASGGLAKVEVYNDESNNFEVQEYEVSSDNIAKVMGELLYNGVNVSEIISVESFGTAYYCTSVKNFCEHATKS